MYLLTSKYILFNYIRRNMRIKIVQVGELEENCYIVEKNNKCLIIDPGSEFNKIKELLLIIICASAQIILC